MHIAHVLSIISTVESTLVLHSLIAEFIRRDHTSTLLLFHCDGLRTADLYRHLGDRFSIPVHSLEVNSAEFYRNHQRFMSSQQHSQVAVVADLGCAGMRQVLEISSENAYYNASYRWLFLEGGQLNTTLQLLRGLDLNIDSRVTITVPVVESENESYELYEAYGTIRKRGGKTHLVKVGTHLNGNESTTWTCNTKLYRMRSDLGGVTLWSIIATLGIPKEIPLEEYLQSLEQPRNYVANRFGYRITVLLSDHLNFKIKYIITNEWGFDMIGKNSTKGIIGQMQQKLVDISTIPMALASERTGSFDQTIEIVTRKLVTLFRHPKNGGTRNIYLQPFQNWLWIAVAVTLVVSACVLLLAFNAERQKGSIFDLQFILIVYGLFCQQGFPDTTVISSSRMTIFTVVLFSVIVYQFYSCFIIGYLLVLPPKNIRTLDQLLASSLKYSIEDLPYNRDYFNRTNRPIALQLYKKKILPNKYGFVNISTGLDLVQAGGNAFHCDTSYGNMWIMEKFSEYEICELQEIELYPTRPFHMILPKGSPLKDPFRVSMRLMMDTGLMQYYRRRFFLKKPPCSTANFGVVQVGFWDIADLYWVLAFGLAASFVALAVEVIVYRIQMRVELGRFVGEQMVWIE